MLEVTHWQHINPSVDIEPRIINGYNDDESHIDTFIIDVFCECCKRNQRSTISIKNGEIVRTTYVY